MSTCTIRAGALALAAFAISMLPLSTGANAAREIKVTIGNPARHPVVAQGWEPYARAVEAQTSGSLKFRIFPGGVLLSTKATLKGIQDGAADAGLYPLTYWPAELPIANLIADLALLGSDAPAMAGATSAFNLLRCHECLEEFAAQGMVYNGTYSTTPYRLITKTPITGVADLAGKKVRSAGAAWTRMMRHFGAVPVSVAGEEMYQAMSQGVLDVAVQPPTALKSFSLWDVATGVTMIPLGTYHSISPLGFSRKVWRELTKAERAALIGNAALMAANLVVEYEEQDEQALKEAVAKGTVANRPDPALVAAVQKFAIDDLRVVARDAEANYGIKDPRRFIEAFRAELARWNDLVAPIRDDREKLRALYQREIFDKLDAASHGL